MYIDKQVCIFELEDHNEHIIFDALIIVLSIVINIFDISNLH